MTTKQQEREALAKIQMIIAGLGEDSYVGAAFEGCIDLAAQNIDNDFLDSMKGRAKCWEKKTEELISEILDLKEALYRADKKAERLERQLEREQEWKPYTDENLISQVKYDALAKSGREMEDSDAIELVANEFGFDRSKVEILREMNTYDINRHCQLRLTGQVKRSPLYDATDWYYVHFTVAGWEYEAYDGTLTKV